MYCMCEYCMCLKEIKHTVASAPAVTDIGSIYAEIPIAFGTVWDLVAWSLVKNRHFLK